MPGLLILPAHTGRKGRKSATDGAHRGVVPAGRIVSGWRTTSVGAPCGQEPQLDGVFPESEGRPAWWGRRGGRSEGLKIHVLYFIGEGRWRALRGLPDSG